MEKTIRKIKICFFSPESYHYFWPNEKAKYGGAELQMFLLANYLSKNPKFEIQFVLGNYSHKIPQYYGNIRIIRGFKLPQNESVCTKIFKAFYFLTILIRQKPDILFTTTANSLIGLAGWFKKAGKYKHLHRTAHLMDVDGMWINNNKLSGKIYKYGLENADKVLSQNIEHCKLLKINHNINAIELKNAYEITQFQGKTPKSTILWVGRFQKWKNPDLFVELASKLSAIEHFMICPFTHNDKNEWEKMANKAHKLKNLTLVSHVRYSGIQEYFNKALLFVNTSSAEGFPNTFLQAAAAKTPIISLNVNPDEFITKQQCGVFCNNNFSNLVKSVEELVNNEKHRVLLGNNAFDYLTRNHDIRNISNKLEEIIDSMI
jgi:glycosyltransferase involved in cell wall biosynthesis